MFTRHLIYASSVVCFNSTTYPTVQYFHFPTQSLAPPLIFSQYLRHPSYTVNMPKCSILSTRRHDIVPPIEIRFDWMCMHHRPSMNNFNISPSPWGNLMLVSHSTIHPIIHRHPWLQIPIFYRGIWQECWNLTRLASKVVFVVLFVVAGYPR